MNTAAAEESLAGSAWAARPALDQALRRRLGWFLLVRTALVTLFLAVAASVYGPQQLSGPDPRLGLIALGYGVTAISALLLPRVGPILLYAGVQIAVDLDMIQGDGVGGGAALSGRGWHRGHRRIYRRRNALPVILGRTDTREGSFKTQWIDCPFAACRIYG